MYHIQKNVFRMLLCSMLFFITSCIKYYDLVKSEFPQGTKLPRMSDVASKYRRSERIYNEFETQALFDVLWLSDDVRTAYVDIYCDKRGLGVHKKEAMLKRELEENKYWLSFYVLADIRDKTYISMSDPHAAWTVSAYLNSGTVLTPDSIKEVDLEPEYQLLFASTFSTFKIAYLIKMPINSAIAEQLSKRNFVELTVRIRSAYKECCLLWTKMDILQPQKVAHDDEDFYWC